MTREAKLFEALVWERRMNLWYSDTDRHINDHRRAARKQITAEFGKPKGTKRK